MPCINQLYLFLLYLVLTHWGRVMHICVSKLTIIGSDNGLSPERCQAIIWINAGVLLIGPLETNFSEILIAIFTFSFKKMHFKLLSGKCWPFCLGLNVLIFNDAFLCVCLLCIFRMSALGCNTQGSVYAPSQWETLLQCNDVSHWLGAYLDWSLNTFRWGIISRRIDI